MRNLAKAALAVTAGVAAAAVSTPARAAWTPIDLPVTGVADCWAAPTLRGRAWATYHEGHGYRVWDRVYYRLDRTAPVQGTIRIGVRLLEDGEYRYWRYFTPGAAGVTFSTPFRSGDEPDVVTSALGEPDDVLTVLVYGPGSEYPELASCWDSPPPV